MSLLCRVFFLSFSHLLFHFSLIFIRLSFAVFFSLPVLPLRPCDTSFYSSSCLSSSTNSLELRLHRCPVPLSSFSSDFPKIFLTPSPQWPLWTTLLPTCSLYKLATSLSGSCLYLSLLLFLYFLNFHSLLHFVFLSG